MENLKIKNVFGFDFIEFTKYSAEDFTVEIQQPTWKGKSEADQLEIKMGLTEREKNPVVESKISLVLKPEKLDNQIQAFKEIKTQFQTDFLQKHLTIRFCSKVKMQNVKKEETYQRKLQEVIERHEQRLNNQDSINSIIEKYNYELKLMVKSFNDNTFGKLKTALEKGAEGWENGFEEVKKNFPIYEAQQQQAKDLTDQIDQLKNQRFSLQTQMRELEYQYLRDCLNQIENPSAFQKEIIEKAKSVIPEGVAGIKLKTLRPYKY